MIQYPGQEDPYGGVMTPPTTATKTPTTTTPPPPTTTTPTTGGVMPKPPEMTPTTPVTTKPATSDPLTVSPQATVSGQIKGLIDQNSPLMQQAQTRALQQMNSRGLINSSMAVGAGQSALYDAAMPIAQADASSAYDWQKTQAGFAHDKNMLGLQNDYDWKKMQAGFGQEKEMFGEKAALDKYMQSAQFQQDKAMFGEKAALDKYMQSAGFAQQKEMFNLQSAFEEKMAQMDDATRRWVQDTSLAAQKELAGMQITAEDRSTYLKAQNTALDTYQRMVAQINSNPDTTPDIKDKALKDAQMIYQQGIQIAATLAGITLPSDLWTRDDTAVAP